MHAGCGTRGDVVACACQPGDRQALRQHGMTPSCIAPQAGNRLWLLIIPVFWLALFAQEFEDAILKLSKYTRADEAGAGFT